MSGQQTQLGKLCYSCHAAISQTGPEILGSGLRGARFRSFELGFWILETAESHLGAWIEKYFGQASRLVNFGKSWLRKQFLRSRISPGRVTRISVQPFRGPLGRQQLNVYIKASNPFLRVRKPGCPFLGFCCYSESLVPIPS